MNILLDKRMLVFLLDSLGATISAIILGVVWVNQNLYVGIPTKTLYILSLIACALAIFSFVNYLLVKKNGKSSLKIIAFANLIYCCITAGFVFNSYTSITRLGLLYFIIEISVILLLVFVELKMAYKQ